MKQCSDQEKNSIKHTTHAVSAESVLKYKEETTALAVINEKL
jgi:hypothetical protein